MCNSNSLERKTALITGCNRGIGKEILSLFVSEGASIIACVRKETPDFISFISELSLKYAVSIELLVFDISNEEEIKAAMKSLVQKKVKIDILVNNAGIATGAFLQMTSMKQLREVFQINFFFHVLITQLVSRIMLKEKKGCIINMGSIAGLENFAGYTAYGSSKAALMCFTKTIARELAPYNIRVNSIAPGLTDTGMAGQMEDKAWKEMVGRSDLNRLGDPKEIAELALFLASDKSSFITGQIIRADGGM